MVCGAEEMTLGELVIGFSLEQGEDFKLISDAQVDFVAGVACRRTGKQEGFQILDFQLAPKLFEGLNRDDEISLELTYYDIGRGRIFIYPQEQQDQPIGNLLGDIAKTDTRQWKKEKIVVPKSIFSDINYLKLENEDQEHELYIRELKIVRHQATQAEAVFFDFTKSLVGKASDGNEVEPLYVENVRLIKDKSQPRAILQDGSYLIYLQRLFSEKPGLFYYGL